MGAEHSLLAIPASALLTVALIVLLRPLLVRYALARPNARSSHKAPTPQGGGIAIMGAVTVLTPAAIWFTQGFLDLGFALLFASALLLALGGVFDDIRPLPPLPRLALQCLAVGFALSVMPVRLFPELIPASLETAVLFLAGVWFVNLVNFMDGLDWITIAEMIPVTGFLALLGWGIPGLAVFEPGGVPLLAAVLCGALIGFAVFNKPVATLFLGDVGSLPIGLLVGWLLLQLAGTGALAAAILLPLYYLADATLTLLRRLARREKVWEAHRSHFYQQATVNGFSVMAVSGQVFALNLVLAALAAWTILQPVPAVQGTALGLGALLVAGLLRRFATGRREMAA